MQMIVLFIVAFFVWDYYRWSTACTGKLSLNKDSLNDYFKLGFPFKKGCPKPTPTPEPTPTPAPVVASTFVEAKQALIEKYRNDPDPTFNVNLGTGYMTTGGVPIKIPGLSSIPADVAQDSYRLGVVIISSAVKKVDYMVQSNIQTSTVDSEGKTIYVRTINVEPVVMGSEILKYEPNRDSGTILLNRYYMNVGGYSAITFKSNDIPDFLRIL